MLDARYVAFRGKASGRQLANPRCGKLMRNSSFDFYTAVVVITLLYSVRGEDKDKTRSTYGGTVTFTTSSLSEPVEVSSNLVKPSSPSALSGIADSSSSNPAEPDALPVPISTLPKPVVRSYDSPTSSVQWMTLLKGSMSYLGVMHSFRLGTEAERMHDPEVRHRALQQCHPLNARGRRIVRPDYWLGKRGDGDW